MKIKNSSKGSRGGVEWREGARKRILSWWLVAFLFWVTAGPLAGGVPVAGVRAASGEAATVPVPAGGGGAAPAAGRVAAGVSPVVRVVTGEVRGAGYDRRIRAVEGLTKTIPAADFFALQAFLEKRVSEDALPPDQLDAVKNDVAGKLLACENLPDDFSRRFLAMMTNEGVGLVWQNYTIQFLDTLWVREARPEMRQKILAALIGATKDKRITIAGTALLTLSRLPAEAGVSKSRLGEMAVGVIENAEIPWQDKITALHVAADAGHRRAPVFAREWVSAEKTPVMLRMAAFSVLGKMGGDEDKTILEKYAKSGEFRLRSASRAALRQMGKSATKEHENDGHSRGKIFKKDETRD